MRKYLLLIAFTSVCICAAAQPAATVIFRYKNIVSGKIIVELPVNNRVFHNRNVKEFPVTKEGNTVLTIPENETGVFHLTWNDNTTRFLLQKGDRLIIDIDSAAMEMFQYSGNNAEGQACFSGKEHPEYTSPIIALTKKDTTLALLTAHLTEEKAKKLAVFTQLFEQKKINQSFYDYMQMNLDYLYVCAASGIMYNRIGEAITVHEQNRYTPFQEEYLAYWDKIMLETPAYRKGASRMQSYITFASKYVTEYCRSKYFLEKGSHYLSVAEEWKRNLVIIHDHFPQEQEYIEAVQLSLMYSSRHYEKELPSFYAAFKKRYPQNKYSASLEPFNKQVIEYLAAAQLAITKEQVIITNYDKINSVAELKEKFKGKMFFIDTWASWCGPCKEEFAYSSGLTAFLKKNKIEILYLSLDKYENEPAWKKMIGFFKLSGYHVRANDRLNLDFHKTFNVTMIPRYLLIDEKGEAVEVDLESPSSKEKLYAQIAAHVKK